MSGKRSVNDQRRTPTKLVIHSDIEKQKGNQFNEDVNDIVMIISGSYDMTDIDMLVITGQTSG